jgi:undecaprenyl diphosphate synthase
MSGAGLVPQHVAIVMDGNGRWAERRGYPRPFGHIRGTRQIKGIVKEANRLGVKALSLYAFSTENWNRPDTELSILWRLLKKFLRRESDELDRENVQLRVLGEVERLAPDIREELDPVIARLSKNTGLCLNLCVSYGARAEILRAAQLFAADCIQQHRDPASLSEAEFSSYLWTGNLGALGNVDLVIRTSGEIRTSNFLLWQAAYAEYVFMDLCWPDFRAEHFRGALEEFARRDRRFGKVKA